jgi:hypothetical protein
LLLPIREGGTMSWIVKKPAATEVARPDDRLLAFFEAL